LIKKIKNNLEIQFCDSLNIDKFFDLDFKNDNCINKNNLYGNINHIGNLNNGHYFSVLKLNKNKWILFNDTNWIEIKDINQFKNNCYSLIYIKN